MSEKMLPVRALLNVIWLVLAGLWLAIGYVIAAVLLAITIVGIPFAVQAIKLATYALWPFGRTLIAIKFATYALWPFGRTLIPNGSLHRGLSAIANVLWFILAGWWLALGHLITGCLLCLTIIGIPLGIADFKMAGAALAPFGKEVVRLRDLGSPPPLNTTHHLVMPDVLMRLT